MVTYIYSCKFFGSSFTRRPARSIFSPTSCRTWTGVRIYLGLISVGVSIPARPIQKINANVQARGAPPNCRYQTVRDEIDFGHSCSILTIFQVLLLLRIYAIYDGSKKVLLTILLVYIICYITALVTATIGIVQLLCESLLLCSSG